MYKRTTTIITILAFAAASMVSAQTYISTNYILSNAKIVISGGKVHSTNYSFNNVELGNIFGGKAVSANYSLRPGFLLDERFTQRLSISLNPTSWVLNSVTPGTSKITSSDEKIIVLNDGNVKASYSLQVIDSAGTWRASDTVGGNDVNKYVMSGILTDVSVSGVDETYFNEMGSEDLISEDIAQLSTSIKFASTYSAKNGVEIVPHEERTLWLKFEAPKADTTGEQHDIWLIVGAEVSE
ncbi:MAG: hypothetical protein ISS92_04080 [Candidatus Omnitrophica bacterium]|nr:hypothetical protein [Candidatus Omnitrophota bacterium]